MEFKEYQEKAARTFVDLGSKELNNAHMIYGLTSELGEFIVAIENKDLVNVGEELTDMVWYLANYARINNLTVSNVKINVLGDNHLFLDISELADNEKKELAYKKEFSNLDKSLIVSKIYTQILFYYQSLKLSYRTCFELNIAKLQARYPEKFTEEKALNRDLETERKILENQ